MSGLTDRQIELRRNHVTATDSVALCGVHPMGRGPRDVYLEKLDLVEQQPAGPLAEIGLLIQPVLLRWAESELGTKISSANSFRVHRDGILSATLDGLAEDGAIVEAKTTQDYAGEWGDGDADVPEHVLVQVHHQMSVVGADLAYVPTLIRGRELRLYRVQFNARLAEAIVLRAEDFWRQNIVPHVPPDDLPTLETLKALRRTPKKTVAITADSFGWYVQAKVASKQAATVEAEAKRKLLAELGDAEMGVCGFGEVTYYEQSRKAYAVPAWSGRVLKYKERKE